MRRALLAMVLLGCSPALSDEPGFYACEVHPECPPGWSCLSDGRCARERRALREECLDDGDCASGLCTRGPDAVAQSMSALAGYCTQRCANDGDCEEVSSAAECVDELCLVDCRTADDCPGDAGCHIAWTPPDPPPPPTCFALADPRLSGHGGCTSPMDECAPPGFCIESEISPVGVCTLNCDMDVHCPMGTECVETLANTRFCLALCRGSQDCMRGLTCGRYDGQMFCVPPEWAGQTPPLPGRLGGGGGAP